MKERKKVYTPLEYLKLVTLTFLCYVTYYIFPFKLFSITSNSMETAYGKGDKVLAIRAIPSYIKRGDDVLIEEDVIVQTAGITKVNDYFVKKIVGLPGDVIKIKNGILFVNGHRQKYLHVIEDRSNFDETIVPVNSVFLLGNNRMVAIDSREFGPISIKNIKFKVFRIFKNKG